MSQHKYKLWARVEVFDSETYEHEDLDPDSCEYKIYETSSLEDLAEFIMRQQSLVGNYESGVLLELEDAMINQGFIEEK